MSREALYLLLGAALVGAGALTFAGTAVYTRLDARARRWSTRGLLAAYGLWVVLRPGLWPVNIVLVLAVGIAVGVAIGRSLGSAGALIAFLVAVSVVDVVSFTVGPTRWIVEGYTSGRSDLLLHLAASFPVAGRMVPLVGIGDLVVLSAVWDAGRRLGYPPLGLAGVLSVALLAALAVGLAAGGIFFLPFAALALAPYFWLQGDRPDEARSGL